VGQPPKAPLARLGYFPSHPLKLGSIQSSRAKSSAHNNRHGQSVELSARQVPGSPRLFVPISSAGLHMDTGTVRCPFCVADKDFRRMTPVGENRYACPSCWHVTAPKNNDFQCQCVRCIQLRARIEPISQPPFWPTQGKANAAHLGKQPTSAEPRSRLTDTSKLA